MSDWATTEAEMRHAAGDGGNLYDPHPLMFHSGRFWRCAHGVTGIGQNLVWVGCWKCALAKPRSWFRFKFGGSR